MVPLFYTQEETMATKKQTVENCTEFDGFNKIFETTQKVLSKKGIDTYNLLDHIEQFPVEHCLSTGLASLDLHMFCNRDGTEWGSPCGRWCEFAGAEGIGKTYLAHMTAADCMRKKGIVFWVQSEGEFDAQYAKELYESLGVEEQDQRILVQNATDISQLYEITNTVIKQLETEKSKWLANNPGKSFRKHAPPVLFVVDSLAAMVSSIDRNGIEEKGWEKRTRMGSKSSEYHSYFQMTINKFAELGIAGLGTNHMRANMSEYGPDNVPAHDSAFKYYMSLRMMFSKHPKTDSKYYDYLTKSFAYHGKKTVKGYPVKAEVKKIRAVKVEDGIIELPFYHGFGFDPFDCLTDAIVISGVLSKMAGGLRVKPQRKEIEDEQAFIDLKNAIGKDKTTEEEVRAVINSDNTLAASLLKLVYKYGPEDPPDKRGKKKGKDDDEEESDD
jgi:RecA/RadA recombinase